MQAKELRAKFIKFFENRGHKEIGPAPLVLESDPTTLFTSSGMQPLVPYLMGEIHPLGKRLVDSQPSIRLQDIEEVGDNRHTTFFEMLGNWSLGDYFKESQLPWIFEFFTKGLGLPKENLWVSVFEGNDEVPKDTQSIEIWKKIGIPESRIFQYGVEKNWWSRSGTPKQMPIGEIGGPDSEIFYDFGEWRKLHENSPFKKEKCHPNCDCGRFLEIGNSVFMQYKKVGENKLEELPQKNVDFGGGLERIVAAIKDDPDVFFTDVFWEVVEKIQSVSSVKYKEDPKSYRVIADHVRAAVFLIVGGVLPSNKLHGYVLRRLIRRMILGMRNIDTPDFLVFGDFETEGSIFSDLVDALYDVYKNDYLKDKDLGRTVEILEDESNKFYTALKNGEKLVEKVSQFDLYQTYGLPLEVIEELYKEKKLKFNKEQLEKEIEKHKEKSRTTSAGVFKGGLSDHSPEVVRLHTATHLLLASLRKILGEQVVQKGQNITPERSRFDFPNPEKLSDEDLKRVEDMINDVIAKGLPVSFEVMPKDEALKTGAIHAFNEKYADTVKVYFVGDPSASSGPPFSREFCGGPHVTNTSEIGHVKIKKQEKIGTGLVRIYLVTQK